MNPMPDAHTWSTTVACTAECLTCGATHSDNDQLNPDTARRWARHHAEQNPGHHALVERTHGRSYRSEPT